MGEQQYGIDAKRLAEYADEIKSVVEKGVEVAIVIGGGNIFRGLAGASQGMDRVQGDHMGMLATVINGLALQSALELNGVQTRLQSAIKINEVAEPFIRRRAIHHLEKGRVVIFGGGTGNPYFTTDTAAALRASEMECGALLKATKVDGVYDADPILDPDAERYDNLGYMDVLSRDLKVMDAAAISLARENSIPIIVFSLNEKDGFANVIKGNGRFTLIS